MAYTAISGRSRPDDLDELLDVVGFDGGPGGGDEGRLAFAEAEIARSLDRLVHHAQSVQKLLVIVTTDFVPVDEISGSKDRGGKRGKGML